MKATIVDIGNYAIKGNALHLEEQIGTLNVKIDTEAGTANMAIYDSVWRYISEKLEKNPEDILKYIEQFRNSFAKYQSNKSKELAISMGNFVVDTIFNSILRSTDQGVKLLNINVEGQTVQTQPVEQYDEYDAYLSLLNAPEPVQEVNIAGVTFKPEPTSSNVEEVPKKKSHSENRELENQRNQSQNPQQVNPPQTKQEGQKVSKMNMSLPGEDEIIDVEIAVVSGTPKIDPGFARVMPYTRRVSK